MKSLLSTKYNENAWSLGLLVLRIAFGGLMIHHGFDKLTHFENIKGMDKLLGSPTDGVLLVFAEFFCAILVVGGLFTRFAVIPLVIAMAVAYFNQHKAVIFGEHGGETALMYLCAYLTLFFTGPGKYSIDRVIAK